MLSGSRVPFLSIRLLALAAAGLSACDPLPQIADTTFRVEIDVPEYRSDAGPVVLIDEAHHNFHTADGRYATFAGILRADGYVVQPSVHLFTADVLQAADILVIANALHERNVDDWSVPTPSAFTGDEIDVVEQWVSDGGSLWLIADHMPFGGAAQDLAMRFGIHFTNSYDIATEQSIADITPSLLRKDPAIFRRTRGTLMANPVTDGRDSTERVDEIATFTGQGFSVDEPAFALLEFAKQRKLVFPSTAWEFSDQTPVKPAAGMIQAAILAFGTGHVAVFGEAAMFTAQLQGREQDAFGLNSDKAKDNVQLLLNVAHWLDGD